MSSSAPAFVFDLDGTLLDGVYQHVIAWQRAYAEIDLDVSLWRVHRRIGMSGQLLAQRVAQESGRRLSDDEAAKTAARHSHYYSELLDSVHPLPGARDLLTALTSAGVSWVVATSGGADEALPQLAKLSLPDDPLLVCSDDVSNAKPAPELLLAAARKASVEPTDCLVIGDTVWDLLAARRAEMVGVGLLSGGRSVTELQAAQAHRVYRDPADLREHLDELGVEL
ncbi:MAG TPA: HAD family hydrolase [Nocardioidaceae bacterium]|jgi:HAD superfamily hydrolase (TIGR01509 family)|nr:HAD family hydrolase [Nocardioidaceae bacterium]